HAVDAAVDVGPVDAGTAGPDAVDRGGGVGRYELGVLDDRVRPALGVQQRGVAAGHSAPEDTVPERDVLAGDLHEAVEVLAADDGAAGTKGLVAVDHGQRGTGDRTGVAGSGLPAAWPGSRRRRLGRRARRGGRGRGGRRRRGGRVEAGGRGGGFGGEVEGGVPGRRRAGGDRG